jgi:ribosomal protein S10
MIKMQVKLSGTGSRILAALGGVLSQEQLSSLNAVGGRAAANDAREYHRDFDRVGGWRGSKYLGPGVENGTPFGSAVAQAWGFSASDEAGATIANDAKYLGFKVTGGTIRPKRAKALTIPLIPEAKGRRAADYQIDFRTRLFRIRGKSALFERIGGSTVGSRGRRGRAGSASIQTTSIRPVYALAKSVTLKPWPGALPPQDRLTKAFAAAWEQEVKRRMK